MSTPWIEAWKAWLARGAELFVQPSAPQPGKAQRAARTASSAPLPGAPAGRRALPHRSGQRHG